MSEYQYYESQAIDKPLDAKAMAALREITSRAEITSTRLTNEYHWGDFKGDPNKLMDKYFDAFLYFANWGTHRLMFRIPRASADPKALKKYCVTDRVKMRSSTTQLVLDFWSPEDCDEGEWRAWQLSSLLPIRADLMSGDWRCLYLAWLSAVQYEELDEDAKEPPVPPGLQTFSAPLTDFAEFLYLDAKLIEVAAEASPELPSGPSRDEMAPWVAALPEAEKNKMLVRIMRGENLSGELVARFRRQQAPRATAGGAVPRTVGALLDAYRSWNKSARTRTRSRATR